MTRIILIIAIIIISSCNGRKPNARKPVDEIKKDGVSKTYTKDGKLLNEITRKDGLRHGLARTFFDNGKVNLEIPYENDKKQGSSRRYYKSGTLYQETEYVNNEMHGLQKKYGEDGVLLSEAHFDRGQPCLDLKEYGTSGQPLKVYPKILVDVLDEVSTSGRYTLNIYMSNKAKRVKFYKSKSRISGCLPDILEPIPVDKKGVAQLQYHVGPREFVMDEFYIVANVETRFGNDYITQVSKRVAIDN